jgi:hypothetical protein
MLQGYAAVGIKAPGLRRFETFFWNHVDVKVKL